MSEDQKISIKDVSNKTNVIKNKNYINKRAVRKHLNTTSAIIAGKRKTQKTGLKTLPGKWWWMDNICQTHF